MPLIKKSAYPGPPSYQINGHLQTIIPSLFRKIDGIAYQRERIELPDSDFLDLDWIRNSSSKLMIVSHGLEGNSDRHYVKGIVKSFMLNGWDCLAWNCRSCGGEMNRLPRMYHHGASEDLDAVVQHVAVNYSYDHIALTGFSMGGGITLKYLGEQKWDLPKNLLCSVAISVPCNLPSSIPSIHEWQNAFYRIRFLRKLKRKIKAKALMFPEIFDVTGLDKISDFYEFDDRFSAPIHGFPDAKDFWGKISAHQFIPGITIPTLILNAKNDPLLSEACFPVDLASKHPFVSLEIPSKGGHVGFSLSGSELSWADLRAREFAEGILENKG